MEARLRLGSPCFGNTAPHAVLKARRAQPAANIRVKRINKLNQAGIEPLDIVHKAREYHQIPMQLPARNPPIGQARRQIVQAAHPYLREICLNLLGE